MQDESGKSMKLSLIALLLLVPAPSLGAIFGMTLMPERALGKVLFFASKLWILFLPVFWRLVIDKEPLSISRPKHGGFKVAAVLGLAISVIIFAVYFTLGRMLIDPAMVRDMAAETGLSNVYAYIGGAAYWILINSVIEEYVWRWFVVEKCRDLMSSRAAIATSAFIFTVHHIFAMHIYFSWLVVTAVSVGIFIGGAVWSWCYIRYRSIWPGYVSHAIVDLAVFVIGYLLIFG